MLLTNACSICAWLLEFFFFVFLIRFFFCQEYFDYSFCWLNRSTRESTPCSLIRDSNAIDTPGSTTRQRTSSLTNQIIREHIQRNIPTAYEIEEFFACAEKQQQTIFMDKYRSLSFNLFVLHNFTFSLLLFFPHLFNNLNIFLYFWFSII